VGDPDLALDSLLKLIAAADGAALRESLRRDEGTTMRLLSVLGASAALGAHLVSHPEHWYELRDASLGESLAESRQLHRTLLEVVQGLNEPAAMDTLRIEYRRWLLRIAARDLAHEVPLATTAKELSELADATLVAALHVAQQQISESETIRFAVIAMGKCGGEELNYVSDVDVIFVHEPEPGVTDSQAGKIAQQLASTLIRVCSATTAEGTIWPVDAALRPEGKAGALSRTVASHRAYYQQWAKTWEFQALLKARPVAGDRGLGERYLAEMGPMVWQAGSREGFVSDVQTMRHRVIDNIAAKNAARQLKLGAGGLRDVEFAVQLLQLVHGRTDEALRQPATLAALSALTEGGYVGREDGEKLSRAYVFLRRVEHRLQLRDLRRTQLIPEDEEKVRVLGRTMRYLKSQGEFVSALDHNRLEVRRLHEKLFYRPLLDAVARIGGEDLRLTPDAARRRLEALGYVDSGAALRHIEALIAGLSRGASIQKALLPAMLEWFANAADPDAGLFGFRRISETLGSTPWYLKTLRDEGEAAHRLAVVLASSRYATDLLEREPEGVRLLGEELNPVLPKALLAEMRAVASRHRVPEAAVRAVRSIRRRELFRTSVADLLGEREVADISIVLARLTDATLQATLEVALRHHALDLAGGAPTEMALVAMGRYGGEELSYGSDADVMFVHDPVPGADVAEASEFAHTVAHDVRRLLGLPMTDPALLVDADLRPEGRQGPLVRTVASYAAYYTNWSKVWEAQALLRASCVVGSPEVCAKFTKLINPIRYPASGMTEAEVAEVRRIKARVDAERLPQGADPLTHLKLGRGALADIEWCIQLLQLCHAGQVPELRTTRTLAALAAAESAQLLTGDQARRLAEAWRLVSKVRNAMVLITGKQSDQLPRSAQGRRGLALAMGYPPGGAELFTDHYLRVTRRAHAVVKTVFWE
jgi:[glutamine synthetase] adenylyltransferase / [glutamine synthetase]-adenylyl-L-tyrosine phosphorylase